MRVISFREFLLTREVTKILKKEALVELTRLRLKWSIRVAGLNILLRPILKNSVMVTGMLMDNSKDRVQGLIVTSIRSNTLKVEKMLLTLDLT